MLIKALILLLCLTVHVWLWGHWSFDKSAGSSLLLIADSLLLLFLVSYPIYYFSKNSSIKPLFRNKFFVGSIYIYVLITLILSFFSFYGLIQYLLPIKIILLGIFALLKWKNKQRKEARLKTLENQ